MALEIQKGEVEFSLAPTNPSSQLPSSGPSMTARSIASALFVSNSGKKMNRSGRKMYVTQVTGWHNETELHLAAQQGDLAASFTPSMPTSALILLDVTLSRLRKVQCPIVEKLTKSLMMDGRNNGKKLKAVCIIKHSMEMIHLLTDLNPIKVIVDAVINK